MIDTRTDVCSDETPIKTPLSTFISQRKTKSSLTEYLGMKVLDHYRFGKQSVIVSTQSGARSYHEDVEILTSSQEEADTLLILHALHSAGTGNTIHILSPARYQCLHISFTSITRSWRGCMCVIIGVDAKQRIVPLKPIYDAIGKHMAEALRGSHCMTGCDTTGRFSGKGKLTCWNALKKCDHHVTNAFKELGKEMEPSEDVYASVEEFVCRLYAAKSEMTKVKDLRWELFRKNQAEASKLPPTQA